MGLVGTRPIYRPPLLGEPLHLRDDGHWSTRGLALCCYANQGTGSIIPDVSRGNHHAHVAPERLAWRTLTDKAGSRLGAYDIVNLNHNRSMRCATPSVNFGDGSEGTLICWLHDLYFNQIFWDLTGGYYNLSFYRIDGFTFNFFKNNPASYNKLVWGTAWKAASRMAAATWRPNPGGVGGYEVSGYTDGALSVRRTDIPNPLFPGAPPVSWIGAYNMTIMQWMVYERHLGPEEMLGLSADPDLPLWRPRRGISLALVGGGAVLPMFGGYNLGKSLLRGANL